jgi:SAM-dependent methyltransferase
MFPENRIEAAEADVEQIVALAGFEGTEVLDLCSGPGRHSVALARRGLSVTGVDRSTFLLSRARERAAAAGVCVEWVQEDMRRFVRPGAFGLAVNLFTSFGYFDDADNQRVLDNLSRNLRPGGKAVIDVFSKERLARVFEATSSEVQPDGSVFIERREIYDDWHRVRNEWILIRDGEASTYRLDLAVYSGVELRDRLERAGFGAVRLYGGYGGEPYDREARRLVAVATR